jgi:hypothetical protein
VAVAFFARCERKTLSPRTLARLAQRIGLTTPAPGEKPIAAIMAADVSAVLRKVEAAGIYHAAVRLRATCLRIVRIEQPDVWTFRGGVITHPGIPT